MTAPQTRHTPGPWRANKVAVNPQAGGYVVLWPDTSKPGVHHRRLDYRGEFLAADATLMAAAPDLLEALIAAEAAMNRIRCTSHTVPWEDTGPAVEQARAAIAKATEVQQ